MKALLRTALLILVALSVTALMGCNGAASHEMDDHAGHTHADQGHNCAKEHPGVTHRDWAYQNAYTSSPRRTSRPF